MANNKKKVLKKSKQKINLMTLISYIFLGVILAGFFLLLILSSYKERGLTLFDLVLIVVFMVVTVKFKLVHFVHSRFDSSPIKFRKPWLFIFLLIVTCLLALSFDVFFR